MDAEEKKLIRTLQKGLVQEGKTRRLTGKDYLMPKCLSVVRAPLSRNIGSSFLYTLSLSVHRCSYRCVTAFM